MIKELEKTKAKRIRKSDIIKQPVEDIQNRVRNRLTPFQLAANLIDVFSNEDEDKSQIISYLKDSNLKNVIMQNIDWFIKMGAVLDLYINDPTFDIEKEIRSYTVKKI